MIHRSIYRANLWAGNLDILMRALKRGQYQRVLTRTRRPCKPHSTNTVIRVAIWNALALVLAWIWVTGPLKKTTVY